jgi:TonB family protein
LSRSDPQPTLDSPPDEVRIGFNEAKHDDPSSNGQITGKEDCMRLMAFVVAIGCAFGAMSLTAASQDSEGVYTPEQGVVVPRIVKEVKPQYTPEARAKKIQGLIGLDAVVLKDGTVGDVNVTKSLDRVYGLDEAAVKAMKQWLFEPGQKDGKPVPVRVNVEMTFNLK